MFENRVANSNLHNRLFFTSFFSQIEIAYTPETRICLLFLLQLCFTLYYIPLNDVCFLFSFVVCMYVFWWMEKFIGKNNKHREIKKNVY